MKIAVCCSSSNDIDKRYLESSKTLLEKIFERENDLVFGATNNGIMGLAYKTAKKYNRNIIGIAPEAYKEDLDIIECDIEMLTPNINERTEGLINNSDVLLFLPGGVGTLYEFVSAIELKRGKEFDKPIIIYNETSFFDEILKMLDEIYEKRFTSLKVKESYKVVNDCESVISLLEKFN